MACQRFGFINAASGSEGCKGALDDLGTFPLGLGCIKKRLRSHIDAKGIQRLLPGQKAARGAGEPKTGAVGLGECRCYRYKCQGRTGQQDGKGAN